MLHRKAVSGSIFNMQFRDKSVVRTDLNDTCEFIPYGKATKSRVVHEDNLKGIGKVDYLTLLR